MEHVFKHLGFGRPNIGSTSPEVLRILYAPHAFVVSGVTVTAVNDDRTAQCVAQGLEDSGNTILDIADNLHRRYVIWMSSELQEFFEVEVTCELSLNDLWHFEVCL